jgi:dihydroneopterin aldolase
MTDTFGVIELEDMEFFAYHGCYKEEQIKGNKFIVNVKVKTNITLPAKKDNIDDALNYVKIYNLVQEEMAQTSHLLEHVASRIINRLFDQFTIIKAAEVKISKIAPPIDGKIKAVSLKIYKRL